MKIGFKYIFFFISSFTEHLINITIILIMLAKFATPVLLKIVVFQNNFFDVTISVNDITEKIESRN